MLNERLLSALLYSCSLMPAQSRPIHDARVTAYGSHHLFHPSTYSTFSPLGRCLLLSVQRELTTQMPRDVS